MVLQGWTFLEQNARVHTRLVQQVRSLGMAHELGNNGVDDVLAGVAVGKNAPNPEVVPPVVRRTAAYAGAPSCQAVDALKSPPCTLPLRNVQTAEPSVATGVHCILEAPPAPAVNAEHRPPVLVEAVRMLYVTVIMQNTSLAATRSGTEGERSGGMFPLQGQAVCRVVSPPVATAVVQGPPSRGEEPMVQEDADPSQGELSIAPKAPDSVPADPLALRELESLAGGSCPTSMRWWT